MIFNQKCIEKLIEIDGIEVRQALSKEHCLFEQIENLKGLLNALNIDQESWSNVVKDWASIQDIVNHLDISFDDIEGTLQTQTAAKTAQKILSKGFEFDQIKIDGFHFKSVGNGRFEAWSPDEDMIV